MIYPPLITQGLMVDGMFSGEIMALAIPLTLATSGSVVFGLSAQ